ncbi:LytR/AlgR family response regulator transcription factor [Fundidesulfovibrio terrae]|uniref:LytR/AlgR family response regulator transcription factor n=1 Tax=Fundidesulfovibrio terrae TaxID=2922866 RepID=UPI001FAEE1BC|nr:LytTR family DNA-binding domain-containing protein [Fundidesulfovibrio terrae]
MNLTVFIIDDEGPVRRELKHLLGRIENVEVVGESPSGRAALPDIRELEPDLIFLDIQMPGLSGLELSYLFGDLPKKPLLVFVTAYEEHAVKAFELDALDYILKPFTLERLRKAVDKARRFLRLDAAAAPQAPAPGQPERRIPLYDGERIVPTLPKHIFFVTSEEGKITVHAVHGRYTVKATISELEARLVPHGFFRAHRSHLVNLNHVAEILPWSGGSYKLIMSDRERTEILVSRYNAKDLKVHFEL